ncbi:MAG: DsrE family protein [Sulfuritalea sp.]|nr:DsrE family protein [Sulfuritalea sp.]
MSKIFAKSLPWGSDDPTRAAMVFGHSAALAKAGHEIRIFLLGEARCWRARPFATSSPVGWPALAEQWQSCVDLGVKIEVCDACRTARASATTTSPPSAPRSAAPPPWSPASNGRTR